MVMVLSVLFLPLVALQASHDELTECQEAEWHLETHPLGFEGATSLVRALTPGLTSGCREQEVLGISY